MNFGQLLIMGRSEYASNRAVHVSDKRFSGDDEFIINKIPMLLDLTINEKNLKLSSIKYYIKSAYLRCQQFRKVNNF